MDAGNLTGALYAALSALAPPPAKAGGGWEGVPTVRADPKGTPPRPSPCLRRGREQELAASAAPTKTDGGPLARHRGHAVTRAYARARSEEHTSELQSLMRISYSVFCLKKKNQ